MTNRSVFLLDLDGSLADHDGSLLADLEKLRSPDEPEMELWKGKHPPHIWARITLIRAYPGWWFNIKPLPRGMKMFNIARDMGFICEVLTKGPKRTPLAWGEKLQWCQKYLDPDINVHIVSDNSKGEIDSGKGRVYGKVLYDDVPGYMMKWLARHPRGLGIMPVNHYNSDFHHPNVIRHDDTDQSERIIRTALSRVLHRKRGEPLDVSDLTTQQEAKVENGTDPGNPRNC